MQALRFDSKTIDEVTKLVGLHLRFHGHGTGEWTDAAVRRYARDAGDQLLRLHKLTRADSTTRNRRKAAALQRTYDHLEQRISILAQAEELAAIRPDLDGNQIMSILGSVRAAMGGLTTTCSNCGWTTVRCPSRRPPTRCLPGGSPRVPGRPAASGRSGFADTASRWRSCPRRWLWR